MQRCAAHGNPPAWNHVWISADPRGHIQATGIDSRGRTQYRYHQVWREERDAQKFAHMLRFAGVLPAAAEAEAAVAALLAAAGGFLTGGLPASGKAAAALATGSPGHQKLRSPRA